MFCGMYGLVNCSMFKDEWVPVAHHILLTGEPFNWEQILFVNLKEDIEKYQKTLITRKPIFYMLGYVMDVFCATSAFPTLGWNWSKNSLPIHIYCSDMWEDNFIPRVYDICDLVLGSMYHKIFKADAPTFSNRATTLIALRSD